jgi:large subunit ribosomal protein L25
MGDKIELKLDERELHGKKVAKLRKEGIVPGIVYGPGIDPISVQVDNVTAAKVYAAAGKHAPVHLTIGSKKKIAMIKDAELDPVKNRLQHISFHAVKASDPVIAEVPIQLIGEGESEAEKAGLIVLQALDKVEVKALPMDLPDAIEISIIDLKEAGEKVTLADAKLPEGVEFVEHDDGHHDDDEEKPSITDLMVASVWEPAALQAQNEAAAGDAEPGDEAEVEAEQGEDSNQPANATEGKSEGNKDFEKKGE